MEYSNAVSDKDYKNIAYKINYSSDNINVENARGIRGLFSSVIRKKLS